MSTKPKFQIGEISCSVCSLEKEGIYVGGQCDAAICVECCLEVTDAYADEDNAAYEKQDEKCLDTGTGRLCKKGPFLHNEDRYAFGGGEDWLKFLEHAQLQSEGKNISDNNGKVPCAGCVDVMVKKQSEQG